MSRSPIARTGTYLRAALILVALGAGPVQAQGYSPDPNAARSSVPDDYKWDLTHLYETQEKWEEEFKAVEAAIPGLAQKCNGHLGDSAEMLRTCLADTADTLQTLYRLYTYAGRAFDQDQSVEENKIRSGRIQMLLPQFSEAFAFMEPELLAMEPAVLGTYIQQDAGLQEWAWYIQDVQRMRPWTLSPAEERILALAGNVADAPYYTHQELLNVDFTFPMVRDEQGNEVPLTVTGFTRFRGSVDPEVRKVASDTFFAELRTHRNTWASLLDGIVKGHIFGKEARGYDSCLEAALTPDNISTDVYRTLVGTVNENLPRTLHKYISLRKKIMGLEGPVTFDNLYNPLLPPAEAENYTYAQAQALIEEALRPLGPDYIAFLREGMDPASGWVDVYPNAKKDSGAYMSGSAAKEVHPYVLMNYDNTLDSVFTLAHEYGHAMHSVYSARHQPFQYSDYATFNAEIASTANEELLLAHMLRAAKKDPEMRLMLLNQRLENIRLTIFRQTLFAEFELAMHEHAETGQPITADFLEKTYGELIAKYYGPDYAIGEDDVIEWAFIPHFYYDFYVFSYATGLTAGISIAQQILEEGAPAAARYKTGLLSAGSAKPPLEILKDAGVDLESPQPILDMLDLFEQTIDEFDREWTKYQEKKAKEEARKKKK